MFVLFPWNKEELKLVLLVVKLADAKVVPSKIFSVVMKIPNLNPEWGNMKDTLLIMKNLIQEMVVVENAWKLFLKLENHVYVKFPSKFEKLNYLLKDVKSALVLVAILVTTPSPVLWDHKVLNDICQVDCLMTETTTWIT